MDPQSACFFFRLLLLYSWSSLPSLKGSNEGISYYYDGGERREREGLPWNSLVYHPRAKHFGVRSGEGGRQDCQMAALFFNSRYSCCVLFLKLRCLFGFFLSLSCPLLFCGNPAHLWRWRGSPLLRLLPIWPFMVMRPKFFYEEQQTEQNRREESTRLTRPDPTESNIGTVELRYTLRIVPVVATVYHNIAEFFSLQQTLQI